MFYNFFGVGYCCFNLKIVFELLHERQHSNTFKRYSVHYVLVLFSIKIAKALTQVLNNKLCVCKYK